MTLKMEIFNEMFSQVRDYSAPLNVTEDDILYAMSKIYKPGPSFYTIFDFTKKKAVYVSPHIQEVLGVNMNDHSIEDLMNLVHGDDLEHIRRCLVIADALFHDILGIDATSHYKRSYQYRLKHADGKYRLMLHQSVILMVDREIISDKSFIYTSDISHFNSNRNDGISFIDLIGHNSFHNIQSIDQLYKKINLSYEFSDREIEILKLLAEGHNSKDIAKALNISYDTVRTHRNNILKKGGFKNISQAIAYNIREGLL